MTDISPTERQVFPLPAGRNVFLAGLEWKTLPSQYRHARDFARAQKADLFPWPVSISVMKMPIPTPW